jgi:hypothetical protein
MQSLNSRTNAAILLHPPVASFVQAMNDFNLERLLATFAEDALVNDQLREYCGKAAIREWAERDLIADRTTMTVTCLVKRYVNLVVTANVDGTFDKRGLPDPLRLTFYFTLWNDLIAQLIILRKLSDI